MDVIDDKEAWVEEDGCRDYGLDGLVRGPPDESNMVRNGLLGQCGSSQQNSETYLKSAAAITSSVTITVVRWNAMTDQAS